MDSPTTMAEAAVAFRDLTERGVTAEDATLQLYQRFPTIEEVWRVCTGVYRLAGRPYGDDPESMVRWFDDRRG